MNLKQKLYIEAVVTDYLNLSNKVIDNANLSGHIDWTPDKVSDEIKAALWLGWDMSAQILGASILVDQKEKFVSKKVHREGLLWMQRMIDRKIKKVNALKKYE